MKMGLIGKSGNERKEEGVVGWQWLTDGDWPMI